MVGLFVCKRDVCMYKSKLDWVCLAMHQARLCVLGSQLRGLCLASVDLQQTLGAVGVLPVQGRLRKGGVGLGVQWERGRKGGGGDKLLSPM